VTLSKLFIYLLCTFFMNKKRISSEVWWNTPVVPALGRLRQEDHEFEAQCIARTC
jgi:hypothetical protein